MNSLRKLLGLLLALLILLSLAACGSASSDSSFAYTGDVSDSAENGKIDTAASYENGESTETAADQKLIYTANVSLETSSYTDSVSALRKLIQDSGGRIDSESESIHTSGSENFHYSDFTIRVEPDKLESFLNSLADIGTVTSRSLSSENITQQYNDNEVQIAALEKEEQRLLAMMDKAETVEDMIAVESRLTEVETQLNQYKTQKSYYDNQVAYTTVYLSLEEVRSYQDVGNSSGFWATVRKTFRNSIHALGTFFVWIFTAILWILPFAVIACIIWLIIRAVRKKRKQKRETSLPKSPLSEDALSEGKENAVKTPQEDSSDSEQK